MDVTGFISTIIVGLVVGILGRLLVPGRQPIGIVPTLLAGIGAAFVGAFLANLTDITYVFGGVDWFKLLVQVGLAGIAALLLAVAFRSQIEPTKAKARTRRRSR